MHPCSLVQTRPFSVSCNSVKVWESFLDKSFQRGVTKGRSLNAFGRNWIDLNPIRAIKEMTYAERRLSVIEQISLNKRADTD